MHFVAVVAQDSEILETVAEVRADDTSASSQLHEADIGSSGQFHEARNFVQAKSKVSWCKRTCGVIFNSKFKSEGDNNSMY